MLHANLATAQREVETLTQARKVINERITTITERIAQSTQAQAEIISRRAAGDQHQGDAAVFSLAQADIDVLAKMRETAQAEVEAIALQRAETRLQAVQTEIAQSELQITFDALKTRATALDAALLACVKELRAVGASMGKRSLSTCWTPSNELRIASAGYAI